MVSKSMEVVANIPIALEHTFTIVPSGTWGLQVPSTKIQRKMPRASTYFDTLRVSCSVGYAGISLQQRSLIMHREHLGGLAFRGNSQFKPSLRKAYANFYRSLLSAAVDGSYLSRHMTSSDECVTR